jgi:hypothetical protein
MADVNERGENVRFKDIYIYIYIYSFKALYICWFNVFALQKTFVKL